MTSTAKFIAHILLAMAIFSGIYAFDASATTTTYEQGTTFSGVVGVWEVEHGRIGLTRKPKLLGYFGGGQARFVGFDCKGYDNPLIGVAAEPLAICKRVVALDKA